MERVSLYRHIGESNFAMLCGIYINMNDFGIGSKKFSVPSNPVIATRSEVDQIKEQAVEEAETLAAKLDKALAG